MRTPHYSGNFNLAQWNLELRGSTVCMYVCIHIQCTFIHIELCTRTIIIMVSDICIHIHTPVAHVHIHVHVLPTIHNIT